MGTPAKKSQSPEALSGGAQPPHEDQRPPWRSSNPPPSATASANVWLYQHNFADGGFSVAQLEAVVNELCERSGEKMAARCVAHNRRSPALLENPSSRKLVDEWLEKGIILYTTPSSSNDDWYWLYATVKLKCLLVYSRF